MTTAWLHSSLGLALLSAACTGAIEGDAPSTSSSGAGGSASATSTSDSAATGVGGGSANTAGASGPGGGEAAGGAGAGGPFDAPEGCLTMKTWKGGENPWNGLPRGAMHPGAACIDCHSNTKKYGLNEPGPGTWIGGTVYALGHETDECFGVDGKSTPTTVEVTDANGKTFSLPVGATGNFILLKKSAASVAFPIKAKVVAGGKERAMKDAVPSGDCNSCHTVQGDSKAPGRIVAP